MMQFVFGSATGWLAMILTAFDITLPFLFRNARFRPSPATRAAAAGYLFRLRPHYWLGYLLLGLSIVHAFAFMGRPLTRADTLGIAAASLAFGLLCLQTLVGLSLQKGGGRNRPRVRALHFRIMMMLCGALILHIWLNG